MEAPLLSGHHMCDICLKKRSVGKHDKCSKIRQEKLASKSATSKGKIANRK